MPFKYRVPPPPPPDGHPHPVVAVDSQKDPFQPLNPNVPRSPPVGVGRVRDEIVLAHPVQQLQEPSRLLYVVKKLEAVTDWKAWRVVEASLEFPPEVVHKVSKVQYEPKTKPKRVPPLK